MSTRVSATKLSEQWSGPEVILLRIKASAMTFHEQYRKAYLAFRHRLMYFDIPIIVFSSVNSVLIAGGKNFLPPDVIEITTCMLALVTGIIQALRTFLKIDETRENCLVTYKDLFRLFCEISTILAQPLRSRSVDAQKFMLDKIAEFKEIIDKAVILEEKTKSNPIYLDGMSWDVSGSDSTTDGSTPRNIPKVLSVPSIDSQEVELTRDAFDSNTMLDDHVGMATPSEGEITYNASNDKRQLPYEVMRHILTYASNLHMIAESLVPLIKDHDVKDLTADTNSLLRKIEFTPSVSLDDLIVSTQTVEVTFHHHFRGAMSHLTEYIIYRGMREVKWSQPLNSSERVNPWKWNILNDLQKRLGHTLMQFRNLSILGMSTEARNKSSNWVTGGNFFAPMSYQLFQQMNSQYNTGNTYCSPLLRKHDTRNHVRVFALMQIDLLTNAFIHKWIDFENFTMFILARSALFASTYGTLNIDDVITSWTNFRNCRNRDMNRPINEFLGADPMSVMVSPILKGIHPISRVRVSNARRAEDAEVIESCAGAVAAEVIKGFRDFCATCGSKQLSHPLKWDQADAYREILSTNDIPIICAVCEKPSTGTYDCVCMNRSNTPHPSSI